MLLGRLVLGEAVVRDIQHGFNNFTLSIEVSGHFKAGFVA